MSAYSEHVQDAAACVLAQLLGGRCKYSDFRCRATASEGTIRRAMAGLRAQGVELHFEREQGPTQYTWGVDPSATLPEALMSRATAIRELRKRAALWDAIERRAAGEGTTPEKVAAATARRLDLRVGEPPCRMCDDTGTVTRGRAAKLMPTPCPEGCEPSQTPDAVGAQWALDRWDRWAEGLVGVQVTGSGDRLGRVAARDSIAGALAAGEGLRRRVEELASKYPQSTYLGQELRAALEGGS